MNFISNSLRTFIVQIVCTIIGLTTTIIITRILGPEGKGYYALVLLVPSLMVQFGNLGIDVANTYFGGSKKYSFVSLASNSFVNAIGLGIILFIGFMTYYYVFHPTFLAQINPLHVVSVCSIIPASLLKTYLSAIILGQYRIKVINLLSIVQAGFSLLLTLIVLMVTKSGLLGLIIAWIVAELIGTILTYIFVWRFQHFKLLSFKPSIFWDTLRFGIVSYSSNVIQFFNTRLDMIMIAAFMNTIQVGYYSIAVSLAESIWYLPGSIALVIFASTSSTDIKDSNKTTPIICRNTLFVTLILGIVLLLSSNLIIRVLFGLDFLPAIQPLIILLPGTVALSISKVLCNEMAGRGKPGVNVIVAGVSLSINIPLNLLLIPRMGISGASIATSASYMMCSITTLIIFSRLSNNRIKDIILLKKSDLQFYRSVGAGLFQKNRQRKISGNN